MCGATEPCSLHGLGSLGLPPCWDCNPPPLALLAPSYTVGSGAAGPPAHLHEPQAAALAGGLDPGQVHLGGVCGAGQQLRAGRRAEWRRARRSACSAGRGAPGRQQSSASSRATHGHPPKRASPPAHMPAVPPHLAVEGLKLLGTVGEGNDLGGAHKAVWGGRDER